MSNALTGDADAVAEVSLAAINRIVASVHARGRSAKALSEKVAPAKGSLSLLHSMRIRIGIIPKPPKKIGSGGGPSTGGTTPFTVDSSEAATGDWSGAAPLLVSGIAELQISTPTVTLAGGSASDVTIDCQIAARFSPGPESAPFPEFVHGRIQVAFPVKQTVWEDTTFLDLNVAAHDMTLAFAPDPDAKLTDDEKKLITRQIRSFLTKRFEPSNVKLEKGIDTLRFKKLLGAGGTQAVALLVNLSKPTLPEAALDTVHTIFLESGDDFAVAISQEYVQSKLDPSIALLRKFHTSFKIKAGITWATYSVFISDVIVEWRPGEIVLAITGRATTGALLFPNYTFAIRQALVLALDTVSQIVSIVPSGEPSIEGLPDKAEAKTRASVVKERDGALVGVQKTISTAMNAVSLDGVLKPFDDSARSRYTSVGILPAGVILRGKVELKTRPSVHVEFSPTPDGAGYTALESWIPGGTVQKYEWSWTTPVWLEGTKKKVLADVELHTVITPRFVFAERLPADASPVCLKVRGTQVSSTGDGAAPVVPVALAFGSCSVGHSPLLPPLPKPIWKFPIAVVEWVPGPDDAPHPVIHGPDDPPLPVIGPRGRIVAHVDAVGVPMAPAGARINPIVHFADAQSVANLALLNDALLASAKKNAPVSAIVVLPPGLLEQDVRLLMETVGPVHQGVSLTYALTEDYEGTWARAFDVQRAPATFLLDQLGSVAWQHEGRLDARSLTAAFDQHLVGGVRTIWQPQRLTVAAGEPAPDFLFDYGQDQQMPLRRLHGREVLLSFWTSWSAPSLAELHHLQELRHHTDGPGPLILAINDGEEPQRAAEILGAQGLTLTLVFDPHRRISQRYGVNCWPTTVSITPEGLVRSVQFGITRHDHAPRRAAVRA
jgi:peroxiredoxin